jgi:hypothetical protein
MDFENSSSYLSVAHQQVLIPDFNLQNSLLLTIISETKAFSPFGILPLLVISPLSDGLWANELNDTVHVHLIHER